jgi:outer membrane receptor protein involved in Fe transport
MPIRQTGSKSLIAAAVAAALLGALTPMWAAAAEDAKKSNDTDDVAELSDIEVTDDPRRVLPNEVSASSFGFAKPLLETPRSVSFVSEEQIELFGLSAVEDLVRLVPGTFTTTRFGIQGGIDVRNVAADTYLRGMKRLSLQGHGRSVLAAMDTIEVVKGPPSPIFGMGKIGGYTNMVPKSGRAKTGAYLQKPEGFTQAIIGEYNRQEFSFGVGGPASVMNKTGGYYAYGLLEDSDSFAKGVPVEQRIGQAAMTLDNFIGPFRLETGFSAQKSRTAGALTGRFNQDLVDTGRYISGTPLVNLDLNGNGSIGFLEMHTGSPVRGRVNGNNTPLNQVFAWPTDSAGSPLPLDQFPKVAGIPQSMYDNLVARCGGVTGTSATCPDPSGLLRQQGVGGPLPISGYVPVGMPLDPRTVKYNTLDMRRSAAYEREVRAQFNTAYVDLIYDVNPDFTMKNQLFFDNMNQHKLSNQPCCGPQDVHILEDKFTLTKRFDSVPEWLRVNSLASINFRVTRAETLSGGGGGDFGTHRSDAMSSAWIDNFGGMTANTTFVNAFDNPDINADGTPVGNHNRSRFWEAGLGVMFDIDFFRKTNLLIGGRYDDSEAKVKTYAGGFSGSSGTSANPGRINLVETTTRGKDTGTSFSISLSHTLPYNIRPYVTYAEASIALDGNNNALDAGIVEEGHIGQARIQEFGVKTSAFNNKLFFSVAHYEQTRINITAADEDSDVVSAYASSTVSRGVEAEVKWVPTKNLFVSLFGMRQKTKFAPNLGGTILVDARLLGFQDVLDPVTGAVIYPAEAFLYGGRSRIALPDHMTEYQYRSGSPETQAGLSANYQMDNGLGFTFSGNWFSKVCTGRLCWTEIPETYVLNAGAFWDFRSWSAKLDIYNLLNERYFKPRTGDTLGDVLAQAMPDRRWQVTAKYKF